MVWLCWWLGRWNMFHLYRLSSWHSADSFAGDYHEILENSSNSSENEFPVTLLLQTQSKTNPRYHGALHCFKTILKEEKFRGLYKGVTSPLLGIAGMNATIFTVNGAALKYYDPDKLINHWWSGCWAGLAQSIIISPVEMIKTQMQIQGVGQQVGKEYRGWRATCGHIYKHAGPKGFLKGISCCVVRDVPSFGAFFVTYEALVGRTNWLAYRRTYSPDDLAKVIVSLLIHHTLCNIIMFKILRDIKILRCF